MAIENVYNRNGYACHCEELKKPLKERKWYVSKPYKELSTYLMQCGNCSSTWITDAEYAQKLYELQNNAE